MVFYITKEGRKQHEAEFLKLQQELQDITNEKNYAYSNCGDTWHDNPTFNDLEQRERRMATKVAEKRNFLNNAQIIEITNRNTMQVSIGSIIELSRVFSKSGKNSIEVWEVVGFGESDPKNKKVGYNTPIGSLLMGMKVNEVKTMNDFINGNIECQVKRFFNNWEEVNQ